MATTKQPLICQVCDSVLNTHMTTDGITYIHPAQLEPAGHDPVPVEPPEGWRGVCDFCLTERAQWNIPAKTFTTPVQTHTSAEDWAACDVCVSLIERNQWNALVRRVMEQSRAKYPDWPQDEIEPQLKALYRALRKNITGAPTRL